MDLLISYTDIHPPASDKILILFRYYCKWWRTGWDGANMPLWKKGNYSVKAPLHISNMADAIMACLDNPSAKGVTFEAYG